MISCKDTVLFFEGRPIDQDSEADAHQVREHLAYFRDREREQWKRWRERIDGGTYWPPPTTIDLDLMLRMERWLHEHDRRKAREAEEMQASLLL